MNKRKFRQIFRFLVGGGVGVLAYYLTLYILTEMAGLWYVTSAVIAFALNNGVNFLIQKYWAFNSTNTKAVPKQLTLYFGMGLVILVVNTVLLYSFVEYVHLHYLIAQLILTGTLTVVSFGVTKKIFKN